MCLQNKIKSQAYNKLKNTEEYLCLSPHVIARDEAISMLCRSELPHRIAYAEIASLPFAITL
ncbi:hypothetical protein BEL04_19580 [Mucilaginibacter sp. PPCGB 2223]|nr:hypothetical protein BEL04_19580 [Mucilaginibacter sp. PPCGB 2223]